MIRCTQIVLLPIMIQHLKILLPFLENTPITKNELIMRFRSHLDTTNGSLNAMLQLLYGLKFTEICKKNNEVVIFD
jgi:hypothetical protein